MKELIIILASSLSRDEMIDKMEEAVDTYRKDKEDGWKLAQFSSSLILSKNMVERDGVESTLDSLDKSERADKLLKTEDN